ncbi:MAG: HD domain-containing protein [Clostridiales bacterium]|nr:HD domain-containing protein [Clostridiales bacterium]
MKYIDTLKEGMRISEIYLCKSKQISLTKAGREYGNLVLQDKTGTIDAKIWDLGSPGIGDFETFDYVRVDADVTLFMNAHQLNVKRIRRAEEREYIPADYLPVSRKNIDEMYAELLKLIAGIRNPWLRKLVDSYFVEDADFVRAFRFHSAAKSVHHGFVGGLLEHTLSVMKLCDYFAAAYPSLNRDLLLTAALFHDVGKLKELSVFPQNDYTDDGQLLGHIIIGTEMVAERIRTIPGFPERLASELKHCILAHHGELEYGSPKKPALLEAMALNFADNADAKLETMIEALQGGNVANTGSASQPAWLGYNRLLETNIRRTIAE